MVDPTPPPATGEASPIDAVDMLGAKSLLVQWGRDFDSTYSDKHRRYDVQLLARAITSVRTAARAEAIRECAAIVRDHAADLKRAGYPYGSLLALDVVTSFESLLASEPARAKGEGGK